MRDALRIVVIVLGSIAGVIAIAGGLFFFFLHHFYFDPPKANFAKPASALEAQRQDIAYFRTLTKLDRSFSPEARGEADARIDRLAQLSTVMPQPKLHVALMQIMALADNGHTKLRASIASRKMPMEPVRVSRFAEGFFVMRAKPEYRDMLGGRVERIDGVPFAEILKKLETLHGGTEAFRAENAAAFIEFPDILYGLGIARDPARSTWTVGMADGSEVTRVLTAYEEKAGMSIPYGPRWRSPEPLKAMGADWVSYAPASGTLPQSERDFDNHFLFAPVAGSCAAYVRVQDIVDTDGQKIQPFLKSTEAALRAHPPCAVIFDLRGNGGGDYTNMWHFAHALPGLIASGGRIYVLTDAMTFSAAITTTAFVKEAGGDKVVIVGEPVGDRLAFYAEGGNATLPNSKFTLGYETGKHDYAHACWNPSYCFWLNWFYPVRVKTLQPDIFVPLRFSDWNAGHDAAFERAVTLAGGGSKSVRGP
jgi:hypothetical protein